MRRRVLAALLAASLFLGVSLFAAAPVASLGIPEPSGGNCAGGSGGLKYAFSGPHWIQGAADLRYSTGNDQFDARGAILDWQDPIRVNGTAQTFTESFGEIVISFEDLGGGTLGRAKCSEGYVKMDDRYHADPYDADLAADFHAVLRHEVGHTLGLYHVGETVDLAGILPTMGTCMTAAERRASQISPDDAAASFSHNGAFWKQANANPGFDRGGWAWAALFGMSPTFLNTGGKSSSDRVRLYPGSGFDSIYQSGIVTSEFPYDTTTIYASAWAKRYSSSTTGKLYIDVLEYPVTFSGSSSCVYPSGLNETNMTVHWGSGGIILSDWSSDLLTSSWRQASTNSHVLLWPAAMYFIRVRTDVQYSWGSPGSIYLDDIHLQVAG